MDELASEQKALEILNSYNLNVNINEAKKTVSISGSNDNITPFDYATLSRHFELGFVIKYLNLASQKLVNLKISSVGISKLQRVKPAKFTSELSFSCNVVSSETKKDE